MIDHGADAATVVANAATDITKTFLNISATGLKQLLLLAQEGSRIKSGQTNMDKLIRALDQGDRISDVKLSKEMATELPELAKKHGVTYAIVESKKGELILYYQETQSDRVKNILEDLTELNLSQDNSSKIIANDEVINSLGKFQLEDTITDKTTVIFDSEKPREYLEIRQFNGKDDKEKSGCQIFYHNDKGAEIISADVANQKVKSYDKPLSFHATGFYTEDRLRSQIDKTNQEYLQDNKELENQSIEENQISGDKGGRKSLDEYAKDVEKMKSNIQEKTSKTNKSKEIEKPSPRETR